MAMKHSGSFVLCTTVVLLGLALALTVGCSSKSGDGGGANLSTSAAGGGETSAAGAGGAVSGEVRVDGSSTVFPITEAVAEEFGIEHPEVHVAVAFSGTGGGMKKLIAKEIGLAGASRPIKAEELEATKAAGVEFIELPVAYDALAVVVHPENTWAESLTIDELRIAWEPGAQNVVKSWSQIRPGFPDEPLGLYGPGVDSGTYDYFTEAVCGEEGASRGDFQASEDDNVLVQGVSNDPAALGFFGMAYLTQNEGLVKAVAIDDGNPDNGDGPQAPTKDNVINGVYRPLSRPLFIYVNVEAAADPAVDAFVRFYLDNAAELATEVGYVPLPDSVYDLVRARYADRVVGSMFEGRGSVTDASLEEMLGQ
jgi:phosphate transport system substrate-binding protein